MTPSELERLAILSEELGEAQQIIGKILRHGWDSCSPFDKTYTTNRELLENELGDVLFAIYLMVERDDMAWSNIEKHSQDKEKRIQEYLHYSKNRAGAKF